MQKLLKTIEFLNGSNRSKGVVTYEKDYVSIGLGYSSVDTNTKIAEIKVKLYDDEGGELHNPQPVSINVNKNKIIINGTLREDHGLNFDDFFPEFTADAMTFIKNEKFFGGKVGDYLK